jgi:hypothetical protein
MLTTLTMRAVTFYLSERSSGSATIFSFYFTNSALLRTKVLSGGLLCGNAKNESAIFHIIELLNAVSASNHR